MRWCLVVALVAAGCGSGLLKDGEVCTASSECAAGLLCDFGPTPHVCRPTSSIAFDLTASAEDMSMPMDLLGVDLSGADFSTTPPDLTAVVDLSGPD